MRARSGEDGREDKIIRRLSIDENNKLGFCFCQVGKSQARLRRRVGVVVFSLDILVWQLRLDSIMDTGRRIVLPERCL